MFSQLQKAGLDEMGTKSFKSRGAFKPQAVPVNKQQLTLIESVNKAPVEKKT